jgi:TDG/mug DNA glycosylase family protein
MRLNALPFTEKLLRIRPSIVCFVGKKIWDVYESVIAKSAQVVESEHEIRDVQGLGVKLEHADNVFTAAAPGPNELTTTADPVLVKSEPLEVGAEVDELEEDEIELKPETNGSHQTPIRTIPPANTTHRRTPAKPKEIFDWTKPRSYRLPHRNDDESNSKFTYFWVVPNTSGLERHTVSLPLQPLAPNLGTIC